MKGDEYWAEKYGLVPTYAFDPVDGSKMIVVDWNELKKMFNWLEDTDDQSRKSCSRSSALSAVTR